MMELWKGVWTHLYRLEVRVVLMRRTRPTKSLDALCLEVLEDAIHHPPFEAQGWVTREMLLKDIFPSIEALFVFKMKVIVVRNNGS